MHCPVYVRSAKHFELKHLVFIKLGINFSSIDLPKEDVYIAKN